MLDEETEQCRKGDPESLVALHRQTLSQFLGAGNAADIYCWHIQQQFAQDTGTLSWLAFTQAYLQHVTSEHDSETSSGGNINQHGT